MIRAEPRLREPGSNRQLEPSFGRVFRAVVDQLYGLYLQNRRWQYFVYSIAFLISVTFASLSTMMFGVSDEAAIVGILFIAILTLIGVPLVYAVGTVDAEFRLSKHIRQDVLGPDAQGTEGLGTGIVDELGRNDEVSAEAKTVKRPAIKNTAAIDEPQTAGVEQTLRVSVKRVLTRNVQVGLDAVVLSGAFWISYLLRYDFAIPQELIHDALVQFPLLVLVLITALLVSGVYSLIWRYIGMGEIARFLKAGSLTLVVLIALRLGLPAQLQNLRPPLSVTLVYVVLGCGAVLGLRVLTRVLYELRQRRGRFQGSTPRLRVLLIGAGRAGALLANEIQSRLGSELEIKGFLDDDPLKRGAILQGVKVLGSTEQLPQLVRELDIHHVVISLARTSRSELRRILDICERIPVKVRVVPGLHEILSGRLKVSRMRDLQIEDLLFPEPLDLDRAGIEGLIKGKTVMITGAGGSIGSELARQVARFQPANLLLVERAEFALSDIDRELANSWPDLISVPLVADVNDESRMRYIFETYGPQIVLHSAAHRHVPMMERNPTEALKTNILATHSLGKLAGDFGVNVFVLTSTDKAAYPMSVMGASHRVAELTIEKLNREYPTRYLAVRLGNVIGSAGSVIPIFREQILLGGPVTVTHPDMTRYFMAIPEAAQLILQAASMGAGGEIFMLDMGEPVRILDLAKEAIRLSGLRPFEDIDIVFTGPRPGEEVVEPQRIGGPLSRTRHPRIFIGTLTKYPDSVIEAAIRRIDELVEFGSEREIRDYLSDLLSEARLKNEGENFRLESKDLWNIELRSTV